MKETVYRRRPSPEVDAAWTDLGADRKLTVLTETVIWERRTDLTRTQLRVS